MTHPGSAAPPPARPATTGRRHGDRARYVHGPDENDTPGIPCRCTPCTQASSAYERSRERQVLYGRWQPYVAAAPAREHLRNLARNGIGWRRAAALSGLSTGSVSKILYGGPGNRPPSQRIRPESETKILAVRPSLAALARKALVDATGPRRRLQALVALGHSQASLARRLSITPQNFTATMTSPRLTAATARAVRDLYDQLWNVPPDESAHRSRIAASRARSTAQANGWPPPLAWDDDDIDDPAARPPEGWQRPKRLPADGLLEDAAELIRWEGSRELAAARLGITPSRLSTTIARAARHDPRRDDSPRPASSRKDKTMTANDRDSSRRQPPGRTGQSRIRPAGTLVPEPVRETTADRDGFTDAARTVTAQYAAGIDLDTIAAHHDDLSATLASEARTGYGRAYATEYGDTARTLIADLCQDQEMAQGRSQAGCNFPDGAPHPDPRLAAHGWQADHGVWVNARRAAELDASDREAV